MRAALLVIMTACLGYAGAQATAQVGTSPGASSSGKNRMVRIVTVTQDRLNQLSGEEIFSMTLERLDRAASFQPDIACLPELFARRPAEAIPGPTTQHMSTWAGQHNCYVICPLKAKVNGRIYNSAVLFDRQGRLVGRYDKIHLTEGEIGQGTTPGHPDPPVFRTDFGTIGIQICFDVNWRDTWRRLKEKGAEIIFWPSAYPADRQLSALAWMNQVYVVSATMGRFARIYDITGDALATTGRFQGWAGAAVSLDKRLFEIDYHVKKMRKIQAKYGPRVRVEWIHAEDWVTLESLEASLSVAELIAEYDLTPISEYHARCEKTILEAQKKAGIHTGR